MLEWSGADERYRRDYARGVDYEDWVIVRLRADGYFTKRTTTMAEQRETGDTRCGMEIKFDRLYADTGNLYIETAERPDTRFDMKDGGIYSPARFWLYLIGDYETIFVFGRKVLQRLDKSGRFPAVIKDTSEGFLLSEAKARHYAEKVIEGEWICIHEVVGGCRLCQAIG